jgi:hypothetical protein
MPRRRHHCQFGLSLLARAPTRSFLANRLRVCSKQQATQRCRYATAKSHSATGSHRRFPASDILHSARLTTPRRAVITAVRRILADNVNCAVKSSFLPSFLESVPGLSDHLKDPRTGRREFEDVVAEVEEATVLVMVY